MTFEDSGRSRPTADGSILAFIIWCSACFLAAALGGLAGAGPGEWYAGLNKPSWNPPGWVFGPVWSVLYTMMAVAAWLVWKRGGWSGQRIPLAIFVVQLVLNAAWSPLFFGLHSPGWAAVDITFLWMAIIATIVSFRPISPIAAWLLVPYIAWVSFAAVLNLTIWKLNA